MIGDAHAKSRRSVAAIDVCRDVAMRARRDRHFAVEGNALFRIAAAYGVVAIRNAEYRDAAPRDRGDRADDRA